MGTLATLSVLGAGCFGARPGQGPAWCSAYRSSRPCSIPTKNAAAAIREVTYAEHLRDRSARIDRTGAIGPGPRRELERSPSDGQVYVFNAAAGREVPRRRGARRLGGEVRDRPSVRRRSPPVPAKSLYTDIASVEVVDPATVKITLKTPNSFLLYNIAPVRCGDPASQDGADQRQASGRHRPFMFKERKEGDLITLAKAPTYRDAASIKLNTVIFKVVKDPSAQVSALLAGDVDAFPGFQAPELVERLKKDSALRRRRRHDRGRGDYGDQQRQEAVQRSRRCARRWRTPINRAELIDGVRALARRSAATSRRTQGLCRPDQDLSVRHRQGAGAARRGGYPNGFEASLKLPPVG